MQEDDGLVSFGEGGRHSEFYHDLQ
jgi:hypothetical protein